VPKSKNHGGLYSTTIRFSNSRASVTKEVGFIDPPDV